MARPKSDLRERLLRAARARFLKHGVDGASLREIARDARTSVAMVTYWFRTKDKLFLAVVEDVYAGLMREVGEAIASGGASAKKSHARTHAYQRGIERVYVRLHAMSDDELAVVRIILREALGGSKRLGALFKRFTAPGGHVLLLLQSVAEGIASGELRDDLPPVALAIATIALAIMPMLARRVVLPQLGAESMAPPIEEGAALLARMVTEGIGSRGDGRS